MTGVGTLSAATVAVHNVTGPALKDVLVDVFSPVQVKEQLSLWHSIMNGESSGWLSGGQTADRSTDCWSVRDVASWNNSMAMWYERQ